MCSARFAPQLLDILRSISAMLNKLPHNAYGSLSNSRNERSAEPCSHELCLMSKNRAKPLACRQYMALDARRSRLTLRPPHCVLVFLLTFTLRTSFAIRTQGTTGWSRACRDTPRLRLWGVLASGSLHTQANLRSASVVCVMCFTPYRSSIVAQVDLFGIPLRC